MTDGTPRSVTGAHETAGPDETVYVFDGGVVESTGARVHVGSGGACIATGGRVSLVDDGWRGLVEDLVPPVAVLRGGEVYAVAGDAWLSEGARYRATGTAALHLDGASAGTVEDGRLVTRAAASAEDVARVEESLRGRPAAPDARVRLDPEPGHDAAAWIAPLVQALVDGGGRSRGTQEQAGVARAVVTHRDPAAALRDLRTRVAVPPSVTVRPEGSGWALDTDYGVGVLINRGGLLSGLLSS